MKIYHVAPADHEGDLESLYCQLGDSAYEVYAERWPEAAELGQYHVHYVHLYSDLSDAIDHAAERGGKIYTVDVNYLEESGIEIKNDDLEFPHPMVAEVIPAEAIVVTSVKE